MIDNLTEAIAHYKERARTYIDTLKPFGNRPLLEATKRYIARQQEFARKYEQLASWLEELKDYREGKRTCENCKQQNKAENQYPCSVCRCNHPNMFEWESEEK